MKIIFVDFDGVLNSAKSFHAGIKDERGIAALSPEHVDRLNKIIEVTDCRIVISSSWRHFHMNRENRDFLVAAGFRFPQHILGCTPKQGFSFRGEEIQDWIDCWENNPEFPRIEKFIILDDLEPWEFAGLWDKVISTTWEDGLQDNHVEECIRRFQ